MSRERMQSAPAPPAKKGVRSCASAAPSPLKPAVMALCAVLHMHEGSAPSARPVGTQQLPCKLQRVNAQTRGASVHVRLDRGNPEQSWS